MLYTGKGVASLLAGPLASVIAAALSWRALIVAMACASALDAWLAIGVLRPLLQRQLKVKEGEGWTLLADQSAT